MELIYRKCKICDSKDYYNAYQEQYKSIAALNGASFVQNIVICRTCGFTISNPSPSESELRLYYEYNSNYENPQNQGNADHSSFLRWERTLSLINKFFHSRTTHTMQRTVMLISNTL